jgi:hypothetical protein
MSSPIDYNAVIADLEAKRGQIDAAIAVIRSLVAAGVTEGTPPTNGSEEGGGGAASPPAPNRAPGQPQIQSDSFFGLSSSGAVRKYLGMMKRPQKPRAIADALRAGGQVHAVDDKVAYSNVATALRRGEGKEFVQTRNGEWGLAEWYGGKSKGEAE